MSCIALISAVPTPTVYRQHAAGDSPCAALVGYAVQRLPTDARGTFGLTLNGLVPGSAIQIQTAAGAALANHTATSASILIPLVAYAPGSPLNDLRIKVRKGSAPPYYQPWSTELIAQVGSSTVFVSQTPDE